MLFFSIIIPCYNVEYYIEKCVQSVLNQNYDNYEVILIKAGLFYKNLYDKQIESGLNIDVYVPTYYGNNNDNMLSYGRYTTISHNHRKIDRYIFHLKHRKIYKDIIREYDIKNYNIIHAHSLFSNGYIAYKLYLEYGVPYVVAIRNTDVNIFFKYMIHLRKMGVRILKNAQKIIFISESYKNNTINKYIPKKTRNSIYGKSTVIPNGIDDFWFTNINNNHPIPFGNTIKLIYTGRVDSNKNIETTVKVCKQLVKQGYNISYKIVGKVSSEKYSKLISKYPFIKYIPHCNRENLIHHYRSADIFIMPSRYETFGLVYAEAMSQGLPVIYSKGQGFDGHFRDGQIGYSVGYKSINEIIEKIKSIIYDYKQMTNNCVQLVDKFLWNELILKYISLYLSAV